MVRDYIKAIKYATKILDAWLPWKIQYDRIPGLAVGIVHNGKLVYQKGFGYADIESKVSITPKTCFRIASISKTFTAVAIMQLAEQRKIDLDDRIEKFLPWFKAQTKGSNSRNITVRQVLSHTGGVFRDGNTPHWENDKFPDLAGLKKSISNKSVVFENLTKFKYSNFGFALLGEVIKKASGLDYNEYVGKNIIKKLGMERTAPDYEKENDGWLAKGYSRPIPGKEREAFPHSQTKAYAPATGFLSNISDLAKYLAAISLKRKDTNILVDKESKKEMTREYWSTGEENNSYGLGFDIYKIEKRKIVGHGGGFAGFITQISLDIENDIGVIILTNTNDSSCGLIETGIFEIIYKFVDERSKYSDGKKIPSQEKFEGVYRSRWGDTIIIGIDTNLVAFESKANSPVKDGTLLKPKAKNKFLMETKSNFDYPGEFATFIFEGKAKRATKVVFGATPSERLEN
jgi:CubicO group peptidase (beta-lactamase class C family)